MKVSGLITAVLGINIFYLAMARSADRNLLAHKDSEFTEFFRRSSGWTAGDGALSVPLTDGSALWLFGDSHVDDIDPVTKTMPCLFQTRNAALLQQKDDFRNPRTLVGTGPGFRS